MRAPRSSAAASCVGACALALIAAHAGCSSSDDAAAPPDTDAGQVALADVAPPPPADAGVEAEAGVDCATDVAADGLPKHLSCATLYSDVASKTVAPENRPYTPGLVFWSDAADKQRWVYLPPGATIDTSNFEEWKMPVGAQLWKEFAIGGKRIETRVFAKLADGWKHTTYRWNDTETDAVRLDGGQTVQLPDRTPFEVPSSAQCEFCHAAHDEPMLGFDAVGLGVPGAKGVTLAALAAEGRLSVAPPATSLVVPDDATGKASAAVGWLHANCGGCHVDRLGAGAYGANLKMRLRAAQLLPDGGAGSATELSAYTTGYCKTSERMNPNDGQYYVYLDGQKPSTSIASILAHSRATPGQESILTQMPPIVTHMPDTAGVALLDAWITALPQCQ